MQNQLLSGCTALHCKKARSLSSLWYAWSWRQRFAMLDEPVLWFTYLSNHPIPAETLLISAFRISSWVLIDFCIYDIKEGQSSKAVPWPPLLTQDSTWRCFQLFQACRISNCQQGRRLSACMYFSYWFLQFVLDRAVASNYNKGIQLQVFYWCMAHDHIIVAIARASFC